MDPVTLSLAKKYAAQSFGNRHVRVLGHHLSAGIEPACILLQGDSTGDEATDWFYPTMQWLASKYPAYTFIHRLWNDTHQNYSGAITTLQTGTAGDAYITSTGGGSARISSPDAAALRITGDLDVYAKVAPDNWTSNSTKVLISKFGDTGNFGWALCLQASTGKPFLWWSTNGTALLDKYATVAPTVTNGQPLWIRATLDVDNGAGGNTVTFYTSADGVTWAQLGSPVVTAGTTSIYASTFEFEIGDRTGGSSPWPGKFYAAVVKSGIDGKIIASPNADQAFPAGVANFKDAEGNTWTPANATQMIFGSGGSPGVMILNGSKPGAVIAYMADPTRFAAQTPIEPQLAFISFGHNQGSSSGYQAAVESFIGQITTKYANAGVVCVTQNPQKSPRTAAQIVTQAQCQRQTAVAAAKGNHGLLDVYRAIMEMPTPDTYTSADGVHPSDAGYALWSALAIEFLRPAVK